MSKAELSAKKDQPGGSEEKLRFTETQIVAILEEAEAGSPVKDLCRMQGITDATYYTGNRSTEA